MGAIVVEAELRARSPHLAPDPLLGSDLHHAGEVASRRARHGRFVEASEHVLHVARIHPGRAHAHERLALAWHRRRNLFDSQRVEVACSIKA